MSQPPTDTRPAPAPSYDLSAILLASLVVIAGASLTVIAFSAPIVTALVIAGAMVTQRLRREVQIATEQFPHTGEERCFCVPGTERCVHI